jgi:hypothetical protein
MAAVYFIPESEADDSISSSELSSYEDLDFYSAA